MSQKKCHCEKIITFVRSTVRRTDETRNVAFLSVNIGFFRLDATEE